MSNHDQDNDEPTNLIFADAPEEFRKQAIDLMVETFGWSDLCMTAFCVHEAWAEQMVPMEVTQWMLKKRDEDGPLMTCAWSHFLLILEEIAKRPSREATALHHGIATRFGVHLDDRRSKRYREAQQTEAEFEQLLNDLFKASQMGYRLIDGELVRVGLEEVARWKRKALDKVTNDQVKLVIESTWNALNTLAEPDLRAAFVGAGILFRHFSAEFGEFLESDEIPVEREELAGVLATNLYYGLRMTEYPFRRVLEDIHVDAWVEEAFSLAAQIYAMPEAQAHADSKKWVSTAPNNRQRRIR